MSEDNAVEMSREYTHALHAEVASLRERLAERDAAIARVRDIDAEKLDLLADWFDVNDARQDGYRGVEVQADLRRWAKIRRALDGPP